MKNAFRKKKKEFLRLRLQRIISQGDRVARNLIKAFLAKRIPKAKVFS